MERMRAPAVTQAHFPRSSPCPAKLRTETRERTNGVRAAVHRPGLSIETEFGGFDKLGRAAPLYSPLSAASTTASPASHASWSSWNTQASELASPCGSFQTPSPLSSPAPSSRSSALGVPVAPIRGGLLTVPGGEALSRARSRGLGARPSSSSATAAAGTALGGSMRSAAVSMEIPQDMGSGGSRPVRAMPMAGVNAAAFPSSPSVAGRASRTRASSLPRAVGPAAVTSPPRRAGSRPSSPLSRPTSAHAAAAAVQLGQSGSQTWSHHAPALPLQPPDGAQPLWQDADKVSRYEAEDLALQAAISQSLHDEEQRRLAAEAAEAEERDLEEARRLSLEDCKASTPPGTRQSSSPVTAGLAETFAPAQWLSDASLTHGFERLAASRSLSQLGGRPSLGQEGRNELPREALLLDPATTFWLALQDDPRDLAEARTSLRIAEREVVLCPMTDSRERCKADSGTHWSLLVCWRSPLSTRWRAVYYDSISSGRGAVDGPSSSSHLSQAAELAERLFGVHVPVSAGSCAHQTNSFDCGVYVLLFSRIIVTEVLMLWEQSGHLLDLGPWLWEPRLQRVTPTQVEEHRLLFWQTLLDSEKV
eukprot:TRINITY_DN21888_c0_g1_i2.p1 TRINITY_DN21888_c0_g1~~TRINITY_DN21888_c0_g1_i2.p1  ORF type:complete len:592 (+),score=93.05 TRINITY_DN21888_c0_g1_i2:43-1818(+)